MVNTFRYKIMTMLMLVGFLTTSCDFNNFLDVNETEDFPTETTSDKRLPGIEGMLATSLYQHTLRDAETSQYITSHWKSTTIWDYRNTYRVGEWRRHYFDVGGNVFQMIERSTEDGDDNYVGVGKTILAYSTLLATDHFGDMPVYDAFTGNVTPHYDAQEDVYDYIFNLLDEAEMHYGKSDVNLNKPMGEADMIYGGDTEKWNAFNAALKARVNLHLTAVQPERYGAVLENVEKAKPFFEDAQWAYSEKTDETNAWRLNPMGPSKSRPQWDHIGNSFDTRVPTTFFMSKVQSADGSIEDPRLPFLMTAAVNSGEEVAEEDRSPAFSGVVVTEGLGTLHEDDFPTMYNGHWTKNTSALPILLKEELYFMEAEAAYQTGNKGRAFSAYIDGITANMQRLGVAGEQISWYLGTEMVAQDSDELRLSHIMGQKFVALYLMAESWTDMRRYNYDATVYTNLTYPQAAADHLNGAWMVRLPYDPQTEYIYNLPEIERLGAQADDWVAKKMWWQK